MKKIHICVIVLGAFSALNLVFIANSLFGFMGFNPYPDNPVLKLALMWGSSLFGIIACVGILLYATGQVTHEVVEALPNKTKSKIKRYLKGLGLRFLKSSVREGKKMARAKKFDPLAFLRAAIESL